jgi:hypothetical protein
MKLYGYAIPPMDFGWEHLPTTKEYLKTIVDAQHPQFYNSAEITEFIRFVAAAKEFADLREGEDSGYRVMTLPPVDGVSAGQALIWKLENNGTTIVVSQVPFVHLDKDAFMIARTVATTRAVAA